MPTFHRQSGLRFYCYSHEPNEPPHIHVDKDDATIKIWLDSLEVSRSRGFRAHEISGIIKIVDEHKIAFLRKWYEHFDQSN